MGQKQSKSRVFSRYLAPLPEYYERNEQSEVYSIRNENQTCIQTTSPQIPHPETLPSKQKHEQQETIDAKTVHSDKTSYMEGLPSHLRHFVIILNDFQTKDYLNHLVYRNQSEFKEFIIQVPFGQVEKNQKYTKIHLYVQEVALTLNHVFNLPFHDMCMILYTALIAYKYLYSYFGLFKIQENMIGFTREGKTKVWINHKLTKDKPLPIVSDINLKRFKEEENYMVDDLMTIFWNKVDRQTVPKNFTLINKFSSIRSSRHNPSRLTLSRIQNEVQLSKSMVRSLENNLIEDFSEGSFDKCLEYLEVFLNMQRPEFIKIDSSRQNPQIQQVESPLQKSTPTTVNPSSRPYRNSVPSIQYLVRNRKQLTRESADLRSSSVNFSLNYRQVGQCSYRHQIQRNQNSKFSPTPFDMNQSKRESYGLIEQSLCRPLNMQNSRPNSFNLPVESTLKMTQQSVCRPLNLKDQSQVNNNQSLIQNSTPSPNKSQKISMRTMMQPVLRSPVTPFESSPNNQSLLINNQSIIQSNRAYSSMNFEQKYPVSNQSRIPTISYANGIQQNQNIMNSQVRPYQFSGLEESQRVNQSSDFQQPNYQVRFTQDQNRTNLPNPINRVVKI